jgi:hypothetical protein
VTQRFYISISSVWVPLEADIEKRIQFKYFNREISLLRLWGRKTGIER